jgi:O-antigen ligase
MTNEFLLAYQSFIFVTVPLALMPIAFNGTMQCGKLTLPGIIFSWSNPIHTLCIVRSWVFFWTMTFGLILTLSSSINPYFSTTWTLNLIGYLISIALFILITARLSNDISDFYGSFFAVLSLAMSLNAVINIYLYIQDLPNLNSYVDFRLTPSFGVAPVNFPTVAGLTYATGLVGAGGVFVLEVSWRRKLIAIVSGLILFVSLCLTQSRGPLGGGLIALIIMFYVNSRSKLNHHLLALPLFLMLSFLLIPKVGALAITRADNHRFEIWRRFLDLALDRPIFGYGERLEVHLYISDGENLGHAHNIYISALLRSGVFGAISLLLSYILSIINTYRFTQICNNPIPLGMIILIVIAGLVDFDQLIFLADWQWISFWLPSGLAVATERRLRTKSNLSLK